MNEERQRYNIDGAPVSLERLCRMEPEWAASRIRHMEAEMEHLQKMLGDHMRYTRPAMILCSDCPQRERVEAMITRPCNNGARDGST